ncbi:MAG TPA: cation-translocating P-type ATPase [Phycisphaerae bacterium]|nr:cation-translocating P-type ATPase [Phycisphaerae bacterium]
MLADFDILAITGLTEVEAGRRLREESYNELPATRRSSVLTIALEVVREPMFLLLVACGSLYLLMGREHIGDALMLLSFVFVVMGITIFQERRTERALEALRDMSSPRALVIRDRRQRRIAGREVARGDIIVLAEGDRVPADAVLMHAISLSVDESLLTGESVPVRKQAARGEVGPARPGGDDLPWVFSGTLVTRGQGVAEVKATGLRSELGKIGRALQSVEQERTLLQKQTGRLVRNLTILGLTLCAVVVVVYSLTRGNTVVVWKEGLLAGITMAMATLPEEFPVVLTIFLALGAWRIAQSNVLTRRVPAIETLGAATVLCSDKTGTLTQNRMTISRLCAGGRFFDADDPACAELPEHFHELLEFSILASKRDPFDPMEQAIAKLGDKYLAQTEHLHVSWSLVHEYPLSPELLALSHVWQAPDGKDYVIAAKGAPEAVGDLCHLPRERVDEMAEWVSQMAGRGLRVLGVGKGRFRRSDLPDGQHDFDFEFLGLVGLADPVRPTVPQAIRECYVAGVRVVMITGDYPETARNIGRQIGLHGPDEIITGPELDAMGDAELARRIGQVSIFARVVPEQKLRIVSAFKANGQVVAMTGDGVNDAPALKSAHIGIAMGGRGTDVAREASALVLLDDDFSSIVQAVRLGRRIFDNIRKAVAYLFAIHVPIAGLSLIPVFFPDWPLILLPVHIVFLELIIDPACSLVFEAEQAEPDVMTRPPRSPSEPLFSFGSISVSILQGLSVLIIVMAVFVTARWRGHAENDARALTFTTLVIANLGLILTNRSWSRTILSTMKMPNPAVWWVLGGAVGFLGLVLYVPFLRGMFRFAPLHPLDLVICPAAGVISIVWFELLKIVNVRRRSLRR